MATQKQMLRNSFKAHGFKTIAQIASISGCSASSVSRALNGKSVAMKNRLLATLASLDDVISIPLNNSTLFDFAAQLEAESVPLKALTIQYLKTGIGSAQSAKKDLWSIKPQYESDTSFSKIFSQVQDVVANETSQNLLTKSAKPLIVDWTEYSTFMIDQLDYLKTYHADWKRACIWTLAAATGCRYDEMTYDWKEESGYLVFNGGKGHVDTNHHHIPCLIPVAAALDLKKKLGAITVAQINGAMAGYHSKTIKAKFPELNDHAPRVTRDIYQSAAAQSVIGYSNVSAAFLQNYVGHRLQDSGIFVRYSSGNVIDAPLPVFVKLAQELGFV